MAIRRRQIGMKSGHKDILEFRLYNKDGSRSNIIESQSEYTKAKKKRFKWF